MSKEHRPTSDLPADRSRSGFPLYEIARIIIPGFYFSALTLILHWTYFSEYFEIPFAGPPLWLVFLVVTLVIGLTMYAKETPKRRKAFQENQPSRYLSNRARLMKEISLLNETDARMVYFYILNNFMPSSFHEKVFYFGTIYHIMIQIRRTSFWFALLTSALILYQISTGHELYQLQPLILFAVGIWLVYLLNVQYNKADRKMQENYRDQIFWLQMHDDLVEYVLKRWSSQPTI
ncbi:MAG: hypothetical protein FJ215_04545 [Ignavibacteria bacterium]|nr:hypothetical protein [Ignavibacteria bacterium]